MAFPTYDGTNLTKVTAITREPVRAGRSVIAKSGKRHWLQQQTRAGHEVLTVEMDNLSRAEADTIFALVYAPNTNAAKTFADGQGTFWSMQREEDSYHEEVSSIGAAGAPRYRVTLRLYQAD